MRLAGLKCVCQATRPDTNSAIPAKIAVKTVLTHLSETQLSKVHFVLFSDHDFLVYENELKKYLK